MRTVSWLATRDGLHVRFNRDESIHRPRATPPAVHLGERMPFLAPLDPEGGGTGLTASTDGTLHALLNHYGVEAPMNATSLSRGVVPYSLASGQWEIENLLDNHLPLQQVRPFHLIILKAESAARCTWNGRHLEHTPLNRHCGCFTTSSLDPQRVIQFRLAAFSRIMASEIAHHPALLDRFHDGIETTGDPAASVLMDRTSGASSANPKSMSAVRRSPSMSVSAIRTERDFTRNPPMPCCPAYLTNEARSPCRHRASSTRLIGSASQDTPFCARSSF